MIMKTLTVLLIALALSVVQSAKILGIFPVPAKSHYILGNALMKGLAEKGHDVTIISPYAEKKPPKKGSYRDVTLTGLEEQNEEDSKSMNLFDIGDVNTFVIIPIYVNAVLGLTEYTLNHTNVQQLLKSGETFDVVIVEQFMNEALKGFAAHFNAPLILLSTIGANTWVNMLTANPAPPSYVPDILLSYSSNMTFCEKTVNTLLYVYNQVLYNFYAFPQQKKLYDKYFPEGPDFYDVLYNGSLYLLNSHPSTNQPVPTVPNMIDIGGFHVQHSKELPQDLQKFLDDSKDGVIYFSMGSRLKTSQLPPAKREAFLETFSKLKQKVLWKWEEDVLPGQPGNVKLSKWFPQQEILAHPNVKLFITHGGLLSTTETIYHGVPVLAIPIAADQKVNAQQVVNQGYGLSLSYQDISEDTLSEKLKDLLENPKYAENAKRRSKIFHDRQVKPLDTATYWVDYIIRHGGAPHLRVAGVDLPWYKYMLVDVTAFIVGVALISLYVFCKVFKVLKSVCCPSKKSKMKRS